MDIQPESFPEAYHPFLPLLERLTQPMLRILQGHLLSLEPLLRTVNSQSQSAKGNFEGIGGLTLRGDINRIIQSELLLRSEVPLEFLRRVSEGEALYMEAEHSNPEERVIYRVIISVGPYMLGHGRLLALASLIFLARAAQSRNAVLHWAYLPTDKQINWFEGLSVNSVKRFLKFASFRDANEEDIRGAIEQWEAFNVSPDRKGGAKKGAEESVVESWLIAASGPASKELEPNGAVNALLLSLDPPPFEGPQTGIIDLQLKGRNVRRITAAFPPDTICVSALNRPFNPKTFAQDAQAEGAGTIPNGQGWELSHVMSVDARHHVIRFKNPHHGLLFLALGKKPNDPPKSVFFHMPDDAKLAGVSFPSGFQGQILSQWNSPNETLFFHELDLRKAKVSHKAIKTVTSKHLFVKQRDHVVPPMMNLYAWVKSYTTLGQPFEFSDIRTTQPSINILYKDDRIIYGDAKYAIVLFDPSKKTSQELIRLSKHIPQNAEGLFLIVLKNHSKVIGVYPCPEEIVANNFKGLCYTPSSHSLACALYDGNWLIMGQNSEEIQVSLSPFQRVLRCHLSNSRCKIVVFSDPELGGDNTLKALSTVNGEVTGYDTLFKFDRLQSQLGQQHIAEIKMTHNGGLQAISLDEDGNPDKLILLQKISGQPKPKIIDLDVERQHCETINYEARHA